MRLLESRFCPFHLGHAVRMVGDGYSDETKVCGGRYETAVAGNWTP